MKPSGLAQVHQATPTSELVVESADAPSFVGCRCFVIEWRTAKPFPHLRWV